MKIGLTMKEALDLKHECESRVLAVIRDFQEATMLNVESIAMTQNMTIGANYREVVEVELEVRLS